jgi:inositol-hexakisphosphate kinase
MLSIDEFRLSLIQFIDNGHQKRLDILPEIIQRLESLYIIINSLLKYRFYSGSLLIVYDGSFQSNHIDVRMIDFANTIRGTNDESLSNHTGPDKGYLFGLESLIKFFREILNDNENNQQ